MVAFVYGEIMNYRNLLALGFCLIGLATPSQVIAEGPRMDPEQRVERLKEDLQLSDDQASKVRDIFANEKGKQSCRDIEDEVDRMQCRVDKKKAINAQLSQVLSTEQMSKLKQIRKEHREKFKEMRGREGKNCGHAHGGETD